MPLLLLNIWYKISILKTQNISLQNYHYGYIITAIHVEMILTGSNRHRPQQKLNSTFKKMEKICRRARETEEDVGYMFEIHSQTTLALNIARTKWNIFSNTSLSCIYSLYNLYCFPVFLYVHICSKNIVFQGVCLNVHTVRRGDNKPSTLYRL